jgi:peptidoglycan/LPS O-acetylase OafA/YrhL
MTALAREIEVESPHARYLRTSFFRSLDGLRCFSILSVMAFHLSWPYLGISWWGAQGVHLFFAISGFLITTLLLREQAKFGYISLKNFYIRRALRIFPLYYAVLLIYTVIIWKTQRHAPQGELFFHNLKWFATYTGNWFMDTINGEAHFWLSWSLATEEQFYLVWPCLIVLAGKHWRIPVLFMIVLAIVGETFNYLVGAGTVNFSGHGNAIATSIATPICLGSLLAYALHYPRSFAVCWSVFGRRWSGILAVLLLAPSLYIQAIPDLVIYIAMIWLIASVCIRDQHPLTTLLTNPIVRYVGTISYGMYLLHMLILRSLERFMSPYQPTLKLLGIVAVTVAAASASYFLYERQFLKLKHAFSASRKAGPSLIKVIEEPVPNR